MPNRILRDWTQSENVDQLSEKAEVFFTRLIMKADDFGYYYGNPKILKAHLYPLKNICAKEIQNCVCECAKAGLIHHYLFDGKTYLQIINFGQRLRLMNSKFPKPTENQTNTKSADKCQSNDSNVLLEVEVETEVETEVEDVAKPLLDYKLAVDFWLKEFHPDWTFGGQHGKALKSILKKIEKLRKNKEDTIVGIFQYICLKLPDWYKNKDLPVIDSKFNEIISEIKEQENGKPTTKTNSGEDRLNALANW